MASVVNRIKSLFLNQLSKDTSKMVILVRDDITMGRGKVGAQCAHAASECTRQALTRKATRGVFNSWILLGQPKIVLRVSNEKELLNIAQNAKNMGLITAVIKDAGRTQLQPGTISVVGIGPGPKTTIDSITGSLRLL